MKYALIVDNIVVQTQPNKQDGFIEVSNDVVCGMIKHGEDFIVKPKTQAELDEQALQTSISEAQALLNDTDFYVIRKMEESIDIPAEIVTARASAKQLLRDNNISYTLEV